MDFSIRFQTAREYVFSVCAWRALMRSGCINVLAQVAAANAALQSCALALMKEHLNSCFVEAMVEGGEQAQAKVSKASQAIARLVRA